MVQDISSTTEVRLCGNLEEGVAGTGRGVAWAKVLDKKGSHVGEGPCDWSRPSLAARD